MVGAGDPGDWTTFDASMRKKVSTRVAMLMRSEHGMKHYPPARVEEFFDRYVAGMSALEFDASEQQRLIEIGSSTKPHSLFPPNGHSPSSRPEAEKVGSGPVTSPVGTSGASPVTEPVREEPQVGPVGAAMKPTQTAPAVTSAEPSPKFGWMAMNDELTDLSSYPDAEGISEPASSPELGGAQPEAGPVSTGGVAAPVPSMEHGPAEPRGDDAEDLVKLADESSDLVDRAETLAQGRIEANIARAVALSEATKRHAESRGFNEQAESIARSRRAKEPAPDYIDRRPQTSPTWEGGQKFPLSLRGGQHPDETSPQGEARRWQSPAVSRSPRPPGGLNPVSQRTVLIMLLALVGLAYAVTVTLLELAGRVSWPLWAGAPTMAGISLSFGILTLLAARWA